MDAGELFLLYEEVGPYFKADTGKYYFFVDIKNAKSLTDGIIEHFNHHSRLFNATDEELSLLKKQRPRRSAIDELNYQIERKDFHTKIIKPSEILSRLPYQSQSRNRNGKQHIADKRFKVDHPKVADLQSYYHTEVEFIKTFLTDDELNGLERGSFAISPCHIEPALTDRDEDSWHPVKICRDLSIMNKGFDKIKACELKGAHAINQEQALIALNYLKTLNWDDMSVTRKVMYYILWFRTKNNFYSKYDITDIGLGL